MAILGVNKRVSQLDQFDDPTKPDGPRIDDLMAPAPEDLPAYSANWWIPLDYKLPEGDALDSDLGTLRLPFNRIAMLDQYGKVPISMLPGYVDEYVVGEMVITTVNPGEANEYKEYVFTRTDEDPHPGSEATVYACPDRTEGQQKPDGRKIYIAVRVTRDGILAPGEIQYRYVEETGGVEPVEEFSPIPESLVLLDGDGTIVTDNGVSRRIDLDIGNPAARAKATNPLQITDNQLVHATSGVTANNTEVFKFIRHDANTGENMFASVTVDKTGHITDVTNDSGENITGYAEYYSKKAVYDDGEEMRGPLVLPACSAYSGINTNGKFVTGLLGGHRYHISLDFQYKVGHAAAVFDRLTSYIKFSENDTSPITLSDAVIDRSMAFPQYFHIDATFKPAGSGSVTGELGLIPGLPNRGSYGTWPPIYANTDDRVSVIRYSIRELL